MGWFTNVGGKSMVWVCAMVLASSAGLAVAMQPPVPKDALRGPEVKDRGVPGDDRRLSDGKDFERGRDRPVPPMAFMRIVNSLRGERAPDGLALTDEQSNKIKGFADEYRASLEKFREAHGEEIRGLMKDLTPEDRRAAMERLGPGMAGRRPGGDDRPGSGPEGRPERGRGERGPRPDGEDMTGDAKPDPAKSAAAKEKLKAIMEQAPKPDGMRTQVFGVLTAEQKAHVEKELEKLKQEGDARLGKRKAEIQLEKAKKDGQGEKGPKGDQAEKRRELREKLRDMTPEERKKAVEELREKRKGG